MTITPIRLTVFGIFTAALGFALGIAVSRADAPRVYAESLSPDRRFRAVITEQTPWWAVSPHYYHFSIWYNGPYRGEVEGTEAVVFTDSTELGECRFVWGKDSLTIHTPDSSPPMLKASFADRQQQWQLVAP